MNVTGWIERNYLGLFEYGREEVILSLGSFIVFMVTYWGVSLFFIYSDLTGSFSFLKRYKIQPGTNTPLTIAQLKHSLPRVFVNSFIVNVVVGIVYGFLYVYRCGTLKRGLPTTLEFILTAIGIVLVEEVGFYYSHRLFHSPWFYKRYHKLHHEWNSPVAFAAIDAHPLEHFLSNLLPVILGPLIFGAHPLIYWFWIAVALFSTTLSHSGYHLPFMPSPQFHDYHHLKFNNNFGVLGILDSFHGTDSHFKNSKQAQRNRTLTSFTPAHDLYPDPKKTK